MMGITEWKKAMNELVKDFQFHPQAGDLEKLKELVAEAEKIAAWAEMVNKQIAEELA